MAVFKKGRHWYIDYHVSGRRKRERIGPDKRLAETGARSCRRRCDATGDEGHRGLQKTGRLQDRLLRQRPPQTKTHWH
jgi:hypothetical protein